MGQQRVNPSLAALHAVMVLAQSGAVRMAIPNKLMAAPEFRSFKDKQVKGDRRFARPFRRFFSRKSPQDKARIQAAQERRERRNAKRAAAWRMGELGNHRPIW